MAAGSAPRRYRPAASPGEIETRISFNGNCKSMDRAWTIDLELAATLASNAEIGRPVREFQRLYSRAQLAVALATDPARVEGLVAELVDAKTDDEVCRVLRKVYPTPVLKPS
jgi:hypothetical protein